MLDAGAILRLQITSAKNWWQIRNSFCLKGYCAIGSCFTYRWSPNLPPWWCWLGPPANPVFLSIPCSSAESHWLCTRLWSCCCLFQQKQLDGFRKVSLVALLLSEEQRRWGEGGEILRRFSTPFSRTGDWAAQMGFLHFDPCMLSTILFDLSYEESLR